MSYRTYKGEKPSEEFIAAVESSSAVSGGGAIFLTCGYCGRDHAAIESLSESEQEDERRRTERNPEGNILHNDCESVTAREINGIQIVDGCPCNGLRAVEDMIWKERRLIAAYLRARSEKEAAEANRTMSTLSAMETP